MEAHFCCGVLVIPRCVFAYHTMVCAAVDATSYGVRLALAVFGSSLNTVQRCEN